MPYRPDYRSNGNGQRGVTRRRLLGGAIVATAGLAAACDKQPAAGQPVPMAAPERGSERRPAFARQIGLPTDGFAIATDPRFAGGADPTQVRDSSDAIRAAVASGKPVYLPPGNYLYAGAGIDHHAPVIVGAGEGATTVSLATDTTFIDSNQKWHRLELGGIRFNGGTGHVLNRFTGTNVTDYHLVHDCAFIDYTGCSISNNSDDHPYWKITQNIFRGNNYQGTIGIALSGLTDGSTISDNAFLANRVHLKLARGGNNTYIQNNDFLRFGAPQGNPRIDVWFSLSPTDTNAGGGLVITHCKFGNENLDESDLRIVYADESSGPLMKDRWPLLNVASPNWVAGHTVSEVFVNGIGDPVSIPLVRSTTPNVVGSRYGPITLAGSSGGPIFSSIEPLRDQGRSNQFGPLLRATASTVPLPPLVVHD